MTMTKRTELSPFEDMIIAHTLETASGQDELLGAINRLTEERNRLQMSLAQHLWGNEEISKRIREMSAELDTLWGQLRRLRAARRVRMEAALGVAPEEEPTRSNPSDTDEAA